MSGYDDLLSSSNSGFQDSLEDNPFADATSHNANVAQSMIEPRHTSTVPTAEPAEDYSHMSKSLNNLSIDKSPSTQYSPQDTPYEQYEEDNERIVSSPICIATTGSLLLYIDYPLAWRLPHRLLSLTTPTVYPKVDLVRTLRLAWRNPKRLAMLLMLTRCIKLEQR